MNSYSLWQSVKWIISATMLATMIPATTQASDHDTLKSSMQISAAGMKVQNQRMKVISENIANADIAPNNTKAEPYRRKVIAIGNRYSENAKANLVGIEKVVVDKSDFILKYEPQHPAADRDGMVRYPNVNLIMESADAREAQRSFEANLHALEIARSNQSRLLEVLK